MRRRPDAPQKLESERKQHLSCNKALMQEERTSHLTGPFCIITKVFTLDEKNLFKMCRGLRLMCVYIGMQDELNIGRIPTEKDWRMIDLLISGDIEPNRRTEIMDRVLADPALQTVCRLMRNSLASNTRPNEPETVRGWRELCVRMSAAESYSDIRLMGDTVVKRNNDSLIHSSKEPFIPSDIRTGGRTFERISRGLSRVALVGILATVGVYFYYSHELTSPPSNSGSYVHEMTTLPGQQASMRLNDGSFVVLGPDSRMKLAADFGNTSRNIELTGEARFEIAPDPSVSFVIKTPNSNIRVLGTTLNVKDYSDTTIVSVMDGKVMVTSVHDNIPPIVLSKGRVAWVTRSGYSNVREEDVTVHGDWYRHRFVFRDSPLSHVLETIERHYNVTFLTDESVSLETRITAEWENRSLETLLVSISKLTNAEIDQDGSTIRVVAR